MRRTFPSQPKSVYVSGLNGTGHIRFLAIVKHGKGTREVAVDVDPETILKLAKALEATRGHACSTKHSRIADVSEDQFNVGHAVWHVENPDQPMPCVDHSTVIDVPPTNEQRLLERLDRSREEAPLSESEAEALLKEEGIDIETEFTLLVRRLPENLRKWMTCRQR